MVGSKPKNSGSGAIGTSGSGSSAQKNYSYGGTNMTQDAANAKYQSDLAAWRAPTATGTGAAGADIGNVLSAATTNSATGHLGVPTTTVGYGGSGGPAIPTVGVLPTAPTRTTLAKTMTPATTYYNTSQGNGGTGQGRAGSAGYSSSSASRR